MGHCHRGSHDSKNTLEPFGTCPHEQSTLSSDRTSAITSPTSSQNSPQNALVERNSISSIPAWPARGPPASPARPGAGCQPCPLGNHSLRSRPQEACGSLYFRAMPRKEPGAGGGTGTAGGSNQLSFVNVFYLLGGFPFGKIQPHFSKGIQ